MNKLTLIALSLFTTGSFSACGPVDDTLQTTDLGVESTQDASTPATAQPPGPPGQGGPGGPPPGGQPPPRPDFTEAAATLGVSVEDLTEAMMTEPGQEPDFAAIAEKLGVTEEALRAAIPPPPPRDPNGQPPPPQA